MRYTEEDLEILDIDWFCIDERGNIAHFATAGKGFVPDSVLNAREDNEVLTDYILNLECTTTSTVLDGVLPKFRTLDAKDKYLAVFKKIASLGVYSYDANKSSLDEGYTLIARPQKEINVNELPKEVQRILKLTVLVNDIFINNETISKEKIISRSAVARMEHREIRDK